MPEKPCIKVWDYDDAPPELKALVSTGGDEDWLALVPPEYKQKYIPWLEEPHFGCCSVRVEVLPDGSSVHVGCHA